MRQERFIAVLSPSHINDYAFRHYVLGQIPVVLDVLAPCSFGFPKRFHQVFASHADHDPVQECDVSVAFIKCQHQLCGRATPRHAGDHYPDCFA